MPENRFVYRFAHDLRLDDHAGLTAAAARGSVIPALILDSKLIARIGRSPRRAAFFCGAVAALDAELRERGSRLVVRRGEAAATLTALVAEAGASGAAWSASYGQSEMRADEELQSALEEAGFEAAVVADAPAVPPEETGALHTGAGGGYRAFAPYFDVWRDLPVASHEHPLLLQYAGGDLATQALPQPAEFGAQGPPANSSAAIARESFARFLRGDVAHYATAALSPADDATSQMSAYLSFGMISARSMVATVRERLRDASRPAAERQSLRTFARSLARRDFFLQLAWFYPSSEREPLQEKMRTFAFARAHPGLEAWSSGATGFPLVDAGVRQLHQTGWMHPHVRAVAASFLCFDLGVDWRVGCARWDAAAIEDDPALAAGNWQWIAGVGADMAQYPRIYNPERQRRRVDPDGRYVRRWIPELQEVPMAGWGERTSRSRQLSFDLAPPGGYPRPILDHERAARAFLARYRSFAGAS